LLAEFSRFTAGLSVAVNRDLVIANAKLAGEVADAMSQSSP
jgi:pseudouridine-5'-phosphate glycosidase